MGGLLTFWVKTVFNLIYLVELSKFKKELSVRPGQSISGKFKVVSSTLASKMRISRSDRGPRWNVAVMLNDGSGSVRADLSPDILDEEIGSAREYQEFKDGNRDPGVKAQFNVSIKKFSMKLAELNCIVTLVADTQKSLRVTKMEEISGLHLAQMRRRKK